MADFKFNDDTNSNISFLFYKNEIINEYNELQSQKLRNYLKIFSKIGFILNLLIFAIKIFNHHIIGITLQISLIFTMLSFSFTFFNKFQSDSKGGALWIQTLLLNFILMIPFQIISGLLSTIFSHSGDPVVIVFSLEAIMKFYILIFYNHCYRLNLISSALNITYLWFSLIVFHNKLNFTVICFLIMKSLFNGGFIFICYYIEKVNSNSYLMSSFFKKERGYFLDFLDKLKIGFLILKNGQLLMHNNFIQTISENFNEKQDANGLLKFIKYLLNNIESIDENLPEDLYRFLSNEKLRMVSPLEKFETIMISNSLRFSNEFVNLGHLYLNSRKTIYQVSLRYSGKIEMYFKDMTDSVKIEYSKADLKYKSLYLAKIAHDFKNPMLSIISICNSKTNRNQDFLDNELESKKPLIVKLSHYLLYLIEDINYFSKNKHSVKGFEDKEDNYINSSELEESLNFCLDIFKIRQINDTVKNNLQIISDYETPFPNLKIPDKILKQILINLLSNAYKFTFNGFIKLSTKIINFQETKLLRISVEDTGFGITNSIKNKIFTNQDNVDINPDFNLHGSGMGLKIVKDLIEKYGSKIEFESNEIGTQFWFDIEYNDNIYQRTITHEFSTKKIENLQLILNSETKKQLSDKNINDCVDKKENLTQKYRIIICDHEEHNRKSLIEKLMYSKNEEIEIEIFEAKNGVEVLNEICNSSINGNFIKGIIIDETMPLIRGSLCINIIKIMIKENQINDIKICSVTSFIDEATILNIKEKGADFIAKKPLSKRSLSKFLQVLKI